MLKGKNVLIAGGSGLVGTSLAQTVKGLGANIRASYCSREPNILKEDYQRFDFTQKEDCLKATKDMDYVVVCAAQTFGAKVMKENPSVSILPNLKINAGLLEACSVNNVQKVMVMSSATVYPEADYPIKEDQLDLNVPPYDFYFGVGWLNRYIEQLARFYFIKKGMAIGILRPTNIYGPYDEFSDEKSHVLPALIKRALKKENPFVVWGDGTTVRDFIYVDDLVSDLLDIMDKYCVCDPVNVANGQETNIKTAVEVILEACGYKVKPEYDTTKPTAIPYRMIGTEKFKSLFGEKARTPLKEGIQQTVTWYQSTKS